MHDKKLIALDLDGTLLDSGRNISAANHAAIARAQALGIPVVLCSGRYHAGVQLIARQARAADLLVCGNGAQVTTADGMDIATSYLSLDDTRQLATVAQGLGLSFSIYADNTLYSAWQHEVYRYYERNGCPVRHTPTPFPKAVDEGSNILKIEIHGRIGTEQREALCQCIEALGTVVGEGDFVHSIECHDKGVDKGTGLATAAAHYGIPLANTLAVGNAENDVSMLQTAGYAVAMGNAVEELKAVADRVVADYNHSGVAEAIEWFLAL